MNKSILSQLLRDRESFYDNIISGEKLGRNIFLLLIMSVIFFGIYGIVMGIYNSFLQAASSMMKVPLLFILALIICYPALFMINVLLGSKLTIWQSLALITGSFTIIACVLASFAPIPLFFLLIGSSYAFLRLLHVGIFIVAGLAGMKTLNDGLVYACEKYSVYPRQGVRVFKIWVLIFAFVGTQLAWNLRPFLGNKDLEFQLFRKQDSNFYAHMAITTIDFLSGSERNKKEKSNSRSDERNQGPQYLQTEKLREMGTPKDIEDRMDSLKKKSVNIDEE